MIQDAMILVGGLGSRLQSLFPDTAKALVPIAGRPFLDRQLLQLKGLGIKRVILLCGHKAEQFADYQKKAAEFGLNIEVSVESSPLDTGGAIVKALQDHSEIQNFLVLNGDTYFEGDLKPFVELNPEKGGGLIGVVNFASSDRFGSVEYDVQNRLLGFSEKNSTAKNKAVSCGLYSFHRELFASYKAGKTLSLERDVFPNAENLKIFPLSGKFFDIGLPASFAEFNADVCMREAKEENPLLALLLGVMLDGGRVVVTGDKAEDLFNMVPDVIAFEKVDLSHLSYLSRLTERDVIFVETENVDQLWQLNHITGAQIVLLSSRMTEVSLVDSVVQEKDLRSAILSLGKHWRGLEISKGNFQFFGGARRPAVFLDRDGVVIEYVEYISKPEQVVLRPGVVDFLLRAQAAGYARVIVTNQSGLGRGYFDWQTYDKVNQRMLELLANEGVVIDQIQKAPFFEQSERAFGLVRRSLRKPRPGMFHSAKEELGLDLKRSIMIGDFSTDMMAAALAGVGKAVLVKTPHTDRELKKWREWPLLSRTSWGLELPVANTFSDIKI